MEVEYPNFMNLRGTFFGSLGGSLLEIILIWVQERIALAMWDEQPVIKSSVGTIAYIRPISTGCVSTQQL